jgi:hypothetical protein
MNALPDDLMPPKAKAPRGLTAAQFSNYVKAVARETAEWRVRCGAFAAESNDEVALSYSEDFAVVIGRNTHPDAAPYRATPIHSGVPAAHTEYQTAGDALAATLIAYSRLGRPVVVTEDVAPRPASTTRMGMGMGMAA